MAAYTRPGIDLTDSYEAENIRWHSAYQFVGGQLAPNMPAGCSRSVKAVPLQMLHDDWIGAGLYPKPARHC